MEISEQTKKILENFVEINSGIVIKRSATSKGTKIITTDKDRSTYASTTVPETFDNNVCLYDLHCLLSTISIMNNPQLDFLDNNVQITDGKSKVKIVYASEEMIIKPKGVINLTSDPLVEFEIKQESLGKLRKFADVLGVPHLKLFNNSNGEIVFQATDKNNDSSNVFEVVVGSNFSGDDFEFFFDKTLFRMIPGDYKAQMFIKPTHAIRFKHAVLDDLEYIIAAQANR